MKKAGAKGKAKKRGALDDDLDDDDDGMDADDEP